MTDKTKIDFDISIKRQGWPSQHSYLSGFASKAMAENRIQEIRKGLSVLDRYLTEFTILENTHTSNPWRA